MHFCNPELLGSEKSFHRHYQSPILRGREPDATDRDRQEGARKSGELGMTLTLTLTLTKASSG